MDSEKTTTKGMKVETHVVLDVWWTLSFGEQRCRSQQTPNALFKTAIDASLPEDHLTCQ